MTCKIHTNIHTLTRIRTQGPVLIGFYKTGNDPNSLIETQFLNR